MKLVGSILQKDREVTRTHTHTSHKSHTSYVHTNTHTQQQKYYSTLDPVPRSAFCNYSPPPDNTAYIPQHSQAIAMTDVEQSRWQLQSSGCCWSTNRFMDLQPGPATEIEAHEAKKAPDLPMENRPSWWSAGTPTSPTGSYVSWDVEMRMRNKQTSFPIVDLSFSCRA